MAGGRLADQRSRGSFTCESAETIPIEDALVIGSPIGTRSGEGLQAPSTRMNEDVADECRILRASVYSGES